MRFRAFLQLINEISDTAIAKAKKRMVDIDGSIPEGIDLDFYLARFKELQSKGMLKGVDIMTLTPTRLVNLIDKMGMHKTRKEINSDIKKNTEVVFENDKAIVIMPHSYEASCKYGKGTNWCTSYKTTRSFFDVHSKTGYLYYVIPKIPGEIKFAVKQIFYNGKTAGYEIYDDGGNMQDSDDKYYSIVHLEKKFGIPASVFLKGDTSGEPFVAAESIEFSDLSRQR